MSKKITILLVVIAVVVAVLSTRIYYFLYNVPDPPKFEVNRWWGARPRPENEDTAIRPFDIKFDATVIENLKHRIRNRRPLTKPLEGIQSQYGINTNYLNEILEYWVSKYDFHKRAELLNRFPHFKTNIKGLDIHFIRVKPNVKKDVKVLPLLMMHGWPSSSKEFDKVIPMLTSQTDKYNFVFEVVAPDLPGFGYSEGTNKTGLCPFHIGLMMTELMKRLGYGQFYIQAGDWGSQIGMQMATLFPNVVLGFHTNMPISSRRISLVKVILGSLVPSLSVDPKYVNRIYPLRNVLNFLWNEAGYYHLQSTKPDTIGVALTDSPVSLAGYLLEKIAISSSKNETDTYHGGLAHLQIDDVLDTVTINWINNCIVTSSRIYYEGTPFFNGPHSIVHNIPTTVPTAAINFLNEIHYQPDWILRDKFVNLVSSTVVDFGGHFAALQTPEVLVKDIFAASEKFLEFHGDK